MTKVTRHILKDGTIEYRDENGELHREARPARITRYLSEWYTHGVKYMDKTIAGTVRYFDANGRFHREDGPAMLFLDGTKLWFQNGLRHREDGPAAEWSNGTKEWIQNDELHRTDGPAVIYADGHKEYWINNTNYSEEEFNEKTQNLTESVSKNTYMTKQGRVTEYRDENGKLHHDSRAALIDPEGFHFYNHGVKYKTIDPNGNMFWYDKYGQLHRENGPAVEYASGYKAWYQNGKRHRLDGPAGEWEDGSKEWWQNSKLHRLDGPAIEDASGRKEWWIDGEEYTEEEFKEKTQNLTESVTKNVRITKKGRVIEYRDENGKLHHDSRAALIDPDGFHFYNHGVKYKTIDPKENIFWVNKDYNLHRDDGPAVERANGDKYWYQNGIRHREDGPAVERTDGYKAWFQNGKFHREDGPAIEWSNGSKEWYQNGKCHRLDGPAIEWANGDKEWWINDKRYTEKQFKEKIQNLTESVTKNTYITKQGRVIEYRDENDELHHDTRAALIDPDGFHFYNHGVKYKTVDPKGNIYWYNKDGKLHREDGPAVERANGDKYWYQNGIRHREDGPAVERTDGNKAWFQNGKFHREDGPAVERTDGYKAWYQNGKRHRLDGPAVIYPYGYKEWWINDIDYTEQEFKEKTQNLTESVTKNTYMTKQGRVTEYRDENGELHHDTRAALIDPKGFHFYNHGINYKTVDPNGNIFWYNEHGDWHREDGPAIEYASGDKFWCQNGIRHREDGPAVERTDGYKAWFQNDKFHREDGPAIERADGYKAWYQNGKCHRLDGPAIVRSDGTKEYWINDKRYTEKQFKEKTQNLTESPIPNTWDKSELGLDKPRNSTGRAPTFKSRLEYILSNAASIGRGSSRIAVEIDYQNRPTVLKVALNKKGLVQNAEEVKFLSDPFLQNLEIMVPLIDYDTENSSPVWIHTEKVESTNEAQLCKLLGTSDQFGLNLLINYAKTIANPPQPTEFYTPMSFATFRDRTFERLRKEGKTQEEIDRFCDYATSLVYLAQSGLDLNDAVYYRNWGIYKGKPVIIDLGWTDVTKKYYMPKRRNMDEGIKHVAPMIGAGLLATGVLNSIPKNSTIDVDDMKPVATQIEKYIADQASVQHMRIALSSPYAKILINHAKKSGLHGEELAQFLAQCAHESGNFSKLREQGSSSYFNRYDIEHNPKLAKILGNTEPGDGSRYKGRGYIQLTGRYNYTQAAKATGIPIDTNPQLLEKPDVAAIVSIWYWNTRVKPKVTDFGDTKQVTKPINGKLNGLSDRMNKFNAIAHLMGLPKKTKTNEDVIDNVSGIGSVPLNQSVDYHGLKVKMKPSTFLRLASTLTTPKSVDYLTHELQSGQKIGAPFLILRIPESWDQHIFDDVAKVKGHDGRNRMLALQHLYNDEPVEVHLFFDRGLRNKHITPEMVQQLQNGILSQQGNILVSPTFQSVDM